MTSGPPRPTPATSTPGGGHLDTAHRQPVDRADGAGPERRAERLRRHLLVEQRQPGADAVQAERRQLDPARQHLHQRAAGRGDPAAGPAVGSALAFLQNGVQRISATDTSLSGGAPGIMTSGTATAANWSGGTATAGTGGFQVQYQSTDANGVESYQVTSANNGPGPQACGSCDPQTPPPGCRTISFSCSRLKQGWVTASGTGWKPCARSMRKTSTT